MKKNNPTITDIIGRLLGGLMILAFGFLCIFCGAGTLERIIGIPFFVCGVTSIISTIYIIVKKINSNNDDEPSELERKSAIATYVTANIYKIIVVLFIVIMLIIIDINSIKNWSSNGSQMFIFTIIGWACLIYYVFKKIIKTK